jgi:hypothetical protein
MTDNKRAADDAEREAFEAWEASAPVISPFAAWKARAALSSRADGGKGEAVAKALDHCDWSGAPIGNKVIIQQAIDVLSGKPSMTNGSFHCPACGEVMKGPTHCGHCLWDADTCGYAYTAPQAEHVDGGKDSSDAERYRKWVSYSGFTKEHCDETLDAIQVNENAAIAKEKK